MRGCSAAFMASRARSSTESCAPARIVSHARPAPSGNEPEFARMVQKESGIGAQILSDLQLQRVRLLTNHPRKVVALKAYGIEITEQVPLSKAAAVK